MSRHPVGGLTGSTWMRLDLPPNPYDLRAFSQQATELVITVVAGETQFLLVQPKGTDDADLPDEPHGCATVCVPADLPSQPARWKSALPVRKAWSDSSKPPASRPSRT